MPLISEEFPLSETIKRVAEVICDIQHGHGVYDAYEFQRNTYNFVASRAIDAMQELSDVTDKARAWDAIAEKNREIADKAIQIANLSQEVSVQRQIIHDLTDGISGTLQSDQLEKMERALAQIQILANEPSNPEFALDQIFSLALEARR